MLRIVTSPSVAAAKSYYTGGLSKGDYYTHESESQGRWGGRGAGLLGLSGNVQQREFNYLCDNRLPTTGEKLTVRNKANRRVGYDINFHAPKSVSVLYSMTGDKRVLHAFQTAVRETMQQLEEDVHTRVRVGKEMTDRPTRNLLWAEFTHHTARPVDGHPDPHLHSHCFVFNATHDDAEGRWKAIQLSQVKSDAYFYEAAFHNRLSGQLRELGYGIRQHGKFWELEGFDDNLLRRFSRRGREVELLAKKLGIENDDRLKDGLAAKSRQAKNTDLSAADLRSLWEKAMTDQELAWVREQPGRATPDRAAALREKSVAGQVIGYSVDHTLERQSTVSERRLLDTALRQSLGRASLEELTGELRQAPLLKAEKHGTRLYTRQDVLEEERSMLDYAKEGRGACSLLNRRAAIEELSTSTLTPGQRAAAKHVLTSPDRVTLLRGAAGTGKTHLMTWTIDKIRAGGHDVTVLAPSAEASRDVLRREGFKDADTLAKFLVSETMQNRARGQVIWVDEAGLIGSKTMSQLFRTADELGARVILGGDQRQHRSVERGDAFRLLIQKAGFKTTELTEIMRQKGAYRNVAVDLSEGRVREAWRGMEELKAIEQLTPREACERAAKDYVAARRSRRDCLVVSPTHAERRSVTESIREELKDAGFLKKKTHDVRQLVSTDWTEAQRKDAARYEPGLVVQFHRAVGPFKPGERVEVLGTTDSGIRVADADRRRYDMLIPFARARHFSVYTASTLELAGGDRVRITVNGVDAEGTHALHNGSIHEVRSVGRDGSVKLKSGLTLAPDFGHLDHGYVLTSHKSQGKTVDEVLIVQTSRSHGATSAEQLYVSVTRARDRFKIYTDDKDALRELALRGTEREAAVDVFDTERTRERDQREHEPSHEHEHERERQRRRDDYEHDR